MWKGLYAYFHVTFYKEQFIYYFRILNPFVKILETRGDIYKNSWNDAKIICDFEYVSFISNFILYYIFFQSNFKSTQNLVFGNISRGFATFLDPVPSCFKYFADFQNIFYGLICLGSFSLNFCWFLTCQ